MLLLLGVAFVAGVVTAVSPCVLPVLPIVLAGGATQSVTVEAVLITLAYGLGAGSVLLGVAIAARRGMSLRSVRAHAPVVRRALGVAILGVAALMVAGVDKDLQTRVPEYTRALRGLEESAAAQDGLVIVGVHTPEFAFERDADNVRRAVRDLGVSYPVALDNSYGTWTAWQNRYWPAKYFVDRDGRLRYAHFGEGGYEESERVLRRLLAEDSDAELVSEGIDDETPSGEQTPETYLGYQRLDRFVGSELVPDREAEYTIPDHVPLHGVAYGGRWTVEGERIVAGEGARLRLAFHAHDVFLVLGASGESGSVEVSVDGDRVGAVPITVDDLYTLARIPGEKRDHVLDLRLSPGTEAYAFTFG